MTKIDLSNFRTSGATKMFNMFAFCSKLSEIIFPENFDTSNVDDMSAMFGNTGQLSLDLTMFKTPKVISMYRMFVNTSITYINLSSFDTKM